MNKTARVLVLAGMVALSLTGCASMVSSMVKNGPAINRLYVHDDPKVGDYAIYLLFSDPETSTPSVATITLMKIMSVGDNYLVVDWQEKNSKFNLVHIEYLTDLDGNVMEATYINDKGARTKMAIATPTDKAYLAFDYDTLKKTTILTGKDKKEYECYEFHHSISSLGGTVTDVDYLDATRKVKFLKVHGRRTAVLSNDRVFFYITGLLEQGNKDPNTNTLLIKEE